MKQIAHWMYDVRLNCYLMLSVVSGLIMILLFFLFLFVALVQLICK